MKGQIIRANTLRERGWEFLKFHDEFIQIWVRGKDKIKWDSRSRVITDFYSPEDLETTNF